MLTSLFQHIDLYCERNGPEFWAEPVNAVSNLAFILAGIWGVWAVRRNQAGAFAEALAWWVVAIGIGSALFHTFANWLTIWADIVPIATFTLTFTIFALRRFAALRWGQALAVFFGFYAVAGTITLMVPEWLRLATNGSTGYLPSLLGMVFFGSVVMWRGSPAGRYILAAALIFVLSVTCRAIDPVVCGSFPIGTHFLWHLLNGVMLVVLLASVARYGAPPGARPGKA